MVDHGSSENYLIYWLEAGDDFQTRIDRGLDYARYVAHRRRAGTSLNSIYDGALLRFNGNAVLAAEVLRRAITELAEPTPVDDTLPTEDSPIWKEVRTCIGYFERHVHRSLAPRYRDRLPRSRYFE